MELYHLLQYSVHDYGTGRRQGSLIREASNQKNYDYFFC